jgi:hypothetical protein
MLLISRRKKERLKKTLPLPLPREENVFLLLNFRFPLNFIIQLHCKKSLAVFPSQAGMSLTKFSLAGNNLIISAQGEYGK